MGVIHNKSAIKRLRDGTAAAVADLQDQIDNLDPGGGLSVTVTDITEDITTDPEVMAGTTCTLAVLEKYGAIVHFHAEIEGDNGDGVNGLIYTVPDELRPRYDSGAISVYSELGTTENTFYNGGIYATAQYLDTRTLYSDLYWIANPAPAPEPEPGE